MRGQSEASRASRRGSSAQRACTLLRPTPSSPDCPYLKYKRGSCKLKDVPVAEQ